MQTEGGELVKYEATAKKNFKKGKGRQREEKVEEELLYFMAINFTRSLKP